MVSKKNLVWHMQAKRYFTPNFQQCWFPRPALYMQVIHVQILNASWTLVLYISEWFQCGNVLNCEQWNISENWEGYNLFTSLPYIFWWRFLDPRIVTFKQTSKHLSHHAFYHCSWLGAHFLHIELISGNFLASKEECKSGRWFSTKTCLRVRCVWSEKSG